MPSSPCVSERTGYPAALYAFSRLPCGELKYRISLWKETQSCSRLPNILRTVLANERLQADGAFDLLPASRAVFGRTAEIVGACSPLIGRFLILICGSLYNNDSDKNLCFG